MEEILDEPLIDRESLLVVKGEKSEFSEWKLLLKSDGFLLVALNEGFQNRDFRNSNGTSMIDPEAYDVLMKESVAIGKTLSCKYTLVVMILYLFVVVPTSFLQEMSPWALLNGLVASFVFAFAIFHFISKPLFRNADGQLIALVDSHQDFFLMACGVELGHSKPTQTYRWWKDDSGIYMRCPRRAVADDEVEAMDGALDRSDGIFPPIFLCLAIPGDVHITEKAHDASMKVDAKTFMLIQTTHNQMIVPSRIARWCVWLFLLMFFYFNLTIYSSLETYGFTTVATVWVIVYAANFFLWRAQDYRNLRIYRKVAQHVTETLQQDETRAHLAVEFHDSQLPGRQPGAFVRRYQVVQRQMALNKDID
jgi:hypothetical protein